MTCPSDAETTLVDLSQWHPPVDTRAELPRTASAGELCFVKSEDRTYVRQDGRWTPAG